MIGSILGGLIGQGGANDAASGISAASNQAYAANNAQLQRNYAALSPYMSGGQGALGIIGQLLGLGTLTGNANGIGASFQADPNSVAAGGTQVRNYLRALNAPVMSEVGDKYTEDPGYGFRLTEGQRALDRSAASRGMLLSGRQAKATTEYNQGMASQEYENWFNRRMAQNTFNWGLTRDALGDYFNMAGLGGNAAGALTGANTNLATNTSNNIMSGAVAAGSARMAGANALASGIGSGINNMLTGAYLGFGGSNPIFGGRRSGYTGGAAP